MSIRTLLLINLLLTMIVTTTLTLMGNYFLDRKDIEEHLDLFLGQAGLSFQALLPPELTPNTLKTLQKQLEAMHKQANRYIKKYPRRFDYEDRFQIQVWNKHHELILHSSNAPLEPLSNGKTGFSKVTFYNQPWRVFTTKPSKEGHFIVLAERYDIRTELAHRIMRDDVLIMLLAYPLLALLVWIVLGKGLSSLKRIAKEVSDRDRDYLEPVDIAKVPEEIKGLVDELNKLLIRLQEALDREKRFAGDAAHELKTPLAALKTQAQVALRTTDENRINALNNLIRSVDRSTHVVQQLLTLSRMGPENGVLDGIKSFNLRQLVADEIALIAPIAIEKDIDISLQCDDDNVPVLGNPTALSILVRNLLDNGVRYTPPHSEVTISLASTEEGVIFTVADNGPGIPEALQQRVFERFFRVLGTQQSGTGLGLAIVSQIAILHNAPIKLSTPDSGQGLTIQIVFPKPNP
ncbi:MAG: ATP-binding protein [Gammaproteobacteria bacterium]